MIITVETKIKAPIEQVWKFWTTPEHIINWNFATDEWCCPSAKNAFRSGGEFIWRMEAKDGSMGFDFKGKYDEIEVHKRIKYTLDDGRKTEITFSSIGDSTEIVESFEADNSTSLDMQQIGWQSILNNFKKYAESI
ncbi:MAG: SRPBCC family protein [Candidatus Atribacteria bacterium]|nr:SRPBCC family protein [Candidatus Atribacteria bacterium]